MGAAERPGSVVTPGADGAFALAEPLSLSAAKHPQGPAA